jgi:hypothetical protein
MRIWKKTSHGHISVELLGNNAGGNARKCLGVWLVEYFEF